MITKAERKAETYTECTTKLIPVIRKSIGTLSKSFKKYLNTIEKEQHQVAGETASLGTAQTLRNVLIQNCKTRILGIVATLCTVETRLTSGTKFGIPK